MRVIIVFRTDTGVFVAIPLENMVEHPSQTVIMPVLEMHLVGVEVQRGMLCMMWAVLKFPVQLVCAADLVWWLLCWKIHFCLGRSKHRPNRFLPKY